MKHSLTAAALLLCILGAALPAAAQDNSGKLPEQKAPATGTPNAQDELKHPETTPQAPPPSKVGTLQPNYQGWRVAEGEMGELNITAFTYVRYLNQKALEDTYTDSFGRTKALDLRQDIQIQKVRIGFKGWAYDPDLRYNLWFWTSNANQGNGAQVVGAGSIAYRFADPLIIEGGIMPLPTVRTLEGEFPRILKTDSRTIADEYFRGSYTSGISAMGTIAEGLTYRVMLANNLSALGVDAVQLDNKLDTLSGVLVWKPGDEYGFGFGDFENHETAATRFGLHATRSTEDRQSQPGKEDPENTQVRLSDGTAIFDIGAFAPGIQVEKALYQMVSFDAGIKVRGFALEGEYYVRVLSDLRGTGPFPVQRIVDQGFQMQASYFVIPQKLQGYVSGSKIFGDYGDPGILPSG